MNDLLARVASLPRMCMTYIRGVRLCTYALAFLILGSLGTVNSAFAESEVVCGPAAEVFPVMRNLQLQPIFEGVVENMYILRALRQEKDGTVVEYQLRVSIESMNPKQGTYTLSEIGCLYKIT